MQIHNISQLHKNQNTLMKSSHLTTHTHTHTYTHTLPLLKTSAFPVSPNNARTSSSTSWFSGRRGRNLSLVTRCSLLPLHLHPLSIFTLLSLFLSPSSSPPSTRLAFLSCTSGASSHRSALWREKGQRCLAWMEHKQTFCFLSGGRMFLKIEGYFRMSLTCFDRHQKKTPFYIYGNVFICWSGKGCER